MREGRQSSMSIRETPVLAWSVLETQPCYCSAHAPPGRASVLVRL